MNRENETSRRTDTVRQTETGRSRHEVKIKLGINKCRVDGRRVRIKWLSEEL